MINVHGHIFDFRFVPDKFILLSEWMLKKVKRFKSISWLMRKLIPFTDKDVLEKYARFLTTMEKDQYQILRIWESIYPHGTIFCPLTIDLEKMGRGETSEPYLTQVEEVLIFSKESKYVFPFIMIDPRSKYIDELYNICKENIEHIAGIKLYPLIGYYAYDERLERFYKLMDQNKKAVTLHCTPKNAIYYNGKDIDELLDRECPYFFEGRKNKEKTGNFAHPYHTVKVAEKYRNINFNLAHFGGNPEWRDYIIEAMKHNPNIYTDISFTYAKKREQKQLREVIENNENIVERLLYGDDEYMIRTKVNGIPFYSQISNILGEELFEKISEENPRRFLRI